MLRFPDPAHCLRDWQPRGVRHPPGPLEQVNPLGPPWYWTGQPGHHHGQEPRRRIRGGELRQPHQHGEPEGTIQSKKVPNYFSGKQIF